MSPSAAMRGAVHRVRDEIGQSRSRGLSRSDRLSRRWTRSPICCPVSDANNNTLATSPPPSPCLVPVNVVIAQCLHISSTSNTATRNPPVSLSGSQVLRSKNHTDCRVTPVRRLGIGPELAFKCLFSVVKDQCQPAYSIKCTRRGIETLTRVGCRRSQSHRGNRNTTRSSTCTPVLTRETGMPDRRVE